MILRKAVKTAGFTVKEKDAATKLKSDVKDVALQSPPNAVWEKKKKK